MTTEEQIGLFLEHFEADWITDAVADELHEDGPNVTLAKGIHALILAERNACAAALDTIAASSPPGSEPLGFHAGVRHACAGGAAAIRGRE